VIAQGEQDHAEGAFSESDSILIPDFLIGR
jgi:hypothetical protein